MRENEEKPEDSRLRRGPNWTPALLAFALAACGTPAPEVTTTRMIDDKGRQIVVHRICEKRGAPFIGDRACRTETVIHNYCYRTLGRVDCYENPIPGRTALRPQ